MSSATDLEAKLVPAVLFEVYSLLDIPQAACGITFTDDPAPEDVKKAHKGSTICGLHQRVGPISHITIYLDLEHHKFSRLTLIKHEILNTLLHELRHAYQHVHWSPERLARDALLPYALQEKEKDAERWAITYSAKFNGLVKVSRRVRRTSFGRLKAAEERARA